MSEAESNCQHVVLAQSPLGAVSLCPECGVLHLAIHNLSLRFKPSAFAELTRLLNSAQAHLPAEQGAMLAGAETVSIH
ncbi:MAG: hypothetical protein QG667_2594 [Pseudomonadota bacterium]|jgi:hypothetical protein|nr:hypothetical protein [Pseudomonadota bacterium]